MRRLQRTVAALERLHDHRAPAGARPASLWRATEGFAEELATVRRRLTHLAHPRRETHDLEEV